MSVRRAEECITIIVLEESQVEDNAGDFLQCLGLYVVDAQADKVPLCPTTGAHCTASLVQPDAQVDTLYQRISVPDINH